MTDRDIEALVDGVSENAVRTEGRKRRLRLMAQTVPSFTRNTLATLPSWRDKNGNPVKPNVDIAGTRSKEGNITWYVPPSNAGGLQAAADGIPSSQTSYLTQQRFRSRMEAETDMLNGYYGWVGIVYPEYDLLEPWTMLDTEAFLLQAYRRKLALAFKNGYAWTGENSGFISYIEQRFQQMGFVSGRSFDSVLKDVYWNLLICSNCVVIKLRDEDASGGASSPRNGNKTPVAGYVIAPPHTIFPYMDGKGRVEKWRRFFGDARPFRDYPVEDVIHFSWNKKPGHIFGTPLTAPVRDDIFALRRIEENVELLMIHHMFPFVHIKVGTPEAPCDYLPDGTSEIDLYRNYVNSMPKEGVFITDERVDVQIHGAGSSTLDYKYIIEHYKSRIFTGLGMSALDMGEGDSANRATADNISQTLKDTIGSEQSSFATQVDSRIIKEMFQECPGQISVQRASADVHMEFHETDQDGKIKTESHEVNKFAQNAITQTELRRALKQKPLTDEERRDTSHHLHAKDLAKAKAASRQNKSTQNRTAQANQHSTNNGPHKAKSSADPSPSEVTDSVTEEAKRVTGLLVDFARGSAEKGKVTQKWWVANARPALAQVAKGTFWEAQADMVWSHVRISPDPDVLETMVFSAFDLIKAAKEG